MECGSRTSAFRKGGQNMRLVTLAIFTLCSVSLLGCLSIGGSSVTWSENIAVFAHSRDSKLNDDNINTVAETQPLIEEAGDAASIAESDRYTQAMLEWGRPQKIQRVIIKAAVGDLEFFDVQYRTAEGKWETIKAVKNNLKEEYRFTLANPISTRQLRLKVPRQWDSRRVGGQKRATRGETGAPMGSYKKIREIEVYHALPPAETSESTSPQ
jgi:thymidine phosphorylase